MGAAKETWDLVKIGRALANRMRERESEEISMRTSHGVEAQHEIVDRMADEIERLRGVMSKIHEGGIVNDEPNFGYVALEFSAEHDIRRFDENLIPMGVHQPLRQDGYFRHKDAAQTVADMWAENRLHPKSAVVVCRIVDM